MAKYFRIYCETDDKWEYLWNDPDIGITQCPTNNGHTVSLDSESPQQLIEEQAYVKIKEEVTPDGLPATGGHYFVETIIIDVEPGVTAFFNKLIAVFISSSVVYLPIVILIELCANSSSRPKALNT